MRGTTIALAMALGLGLSEASVSASPADLPLPIDLTSGAPGGDVLPPLAAPGTTTVQDGAPLVPMPPPAHPRPVRFAPPPRDLLDSPMIPLPPADLAGSAGLLLAGWMVVRARRKGGTP
jgi:hypothetical protein